MAGDNPPGAGNQQERLNCSAWLDRISPDVGHYIAGFVDGEGSFNVPIRRERDRLLPWRVGLTFNVSQIGPKLPQLLRSVFGAGTVRGRPDGVYYFEVTRLAELEERVFPFFREVRAARSEEGRSGDVSPDRGAGPITTASIGARHRGHPSDESQDESRREAEASGSGDPGAAERVGILRGHTQGSSLKREDEDM